MGASSAMMPPAVGGMPPQGTGIRQVRNFAQDNGLGRNFVQQHMANNNQPPMGTGIRQVREWAQDNGMGRNFVQQHMASQQQGIPTNMGPTNMGQPVNMGPQPANMGPNPFQGQQSMGIQPGSFGTPGVRQVMRPTSPANMKGGPSMSPPAIRR